MNCFRDSKLDELFWKLNTWKATGRNIFDFSLADVINSDITFRYRVGKDSGCFCASA